MIHYIYIYISICLGKFHHDLTVLPNPGIMVDEGWMFMVDEWFWRPMGSCAKNPRIFFSRPGCGESGVSHFFSTLKDFLDLEE